MPESDFICQTCLAFEDYIKLVPCALCTLRGGIMRPTTLKSKEKLNSNKQQSKDGQQKSSKAFDFMIYLLKLSYHHTLKKRETISLNAKKSVIREIFPQTFSRPIINGSI